MDGTTPSSQKVLTVADYFAVDFRYLVEGEATSYDVPVEQKELLKIYAQLTPEQQAPIKDMLDRLKEQIQEGKRKRSFKAAEKMLRNNMNIEDIKTYTDLDIETIQRLKVELEL